jgi:hypothetical protein
VKNRAGVGAPNTNPPPLRAMLEALAGIQTEDDFL